MLHMVVIDMAFLRKFVLTKVLFRYFEGVESERQQRLVISLCYLIYAYMLTVSHKSFGK